MGLFQSTKAFLSQAADDIIASIPQPGVALTPAKGGGFCIPPEGLQPADIIVSTGTAMISLGIRSITGSVVSHAALFTGKDVIEAIGEGVIRQSTETALADDVLAVAYRHPQMTSEIAKKILEAAGRLVEAKTKYGTGGAVLSALPTFACSLHGAKSASFFCSQLVAQAYKEGGLPLSTLPPSCITPDTLVEISIEALVYAGHLKGNPSWLPKLSP